MRPARADQDSTISTTTPPTDPTADDASFDTAASDDFFDTIGTDFDADFTTEAPLAPTTSLLPVAAPAVTAPWRDGAAIDARYSCKGDNVSPALSWSPAPAGTQQIAITMVDLDFTTFDHWTLIGVAADATNLAEGSVGGTGGYSGPWDHTHLRNHGALSAQCVVDSGHGCRPAAVDRRRDDFRRQGHRHVHRELTSMRVTNSPLWAKIS
jgi:hypothetical protein